MPRLVLHVFGSILFPEAFPIKASDDPPGAAVSNLCVASETVAHQCINQRSHLRHNACSAVMILIVVQILGAALCLRKLG
jgi:hypothetical protein